jgi:FlaA1/EpsC-like NDP-sugar epimerase
MHKEGIVVNTKPWQIAATSRKGWSSEITKVCLALTDFISVALSFFVAAMILYSPIKLDSVQVTPLLVAFLWPFIYWREGLYPGYGISRPEKFQKYIIGALLAGWLLLVLKPFLAIDFHFTYPYLILSTALSVFITYPTRLFMQRLLFKLGAWGEPVVIFGAGETGKRIAEILSYAPLTGLISLFLWMNQYTE